MASVETVTILFTDLVGSTELSSRVGPERSEGLRVEHFALLREAVAASGGREVKNLGDGLMVSFSSAAAAVECAASMQQRFEVRNRSADECLGVRIGVSMGDATREEGDYFGPPVVEAARLCAKADGGQILLPEVTRVMVGRRGDHRFSSVGELELKGLPDPLAACELVWEPLTVAAAPLPDRLQVVHATVYVGREKLRARLSESWRLASSGERQVVMLAGEPGIGKTRAATNLAVEAHGSGGTVLYGHCGEEVTMAYQPWAEALRGLIEHCPLEVLEEHVGEYGGEIRRLVPEIATRVPEAPDPRPSDPETERYLMFRAVTGLLHTAGGDAPVMVALDDLHWADDASLALLKHVVANLLRSRLLIVCTYRDSDLAAADSLNSLLADLRRAEAVQWAPLVGLEPYEVASLIEAAAGHELDTEGLHLAEAVSRETDGNPFFISEILLHLVESGAVVQGADGRYALSADVTALGLPRGVRDVVGQRIHRLGESAGRVLRAASVIGREFDLNLLAKVLDRGEDEVLDSLESAIAGTVLRESAETPGCFTFVHALINRTLYEDMSLTRRARMHRRVAEELETLCRDHPDDRLGELAHHWSQATQSVDIPKAVSYARRAGEQALAKLAPLEALRWFTQALEQLAALTGDHDEERCELLILLGEAKRQAGDPTFRETLLDAGALAQHTGDADRMARAALGNHSPLGFSGAGELDRQRVEALERAVALQPAISAYRPRLLAQLAAERSFREPNFDSRIAPLIDEALELGGDPQTVGHVLMMGSSALFNALHRIEDRRRLAQDLENLAERLGDANLIFSGAMWRSFAAYELGELAEAQDRAQRLRDVAAGTGQPGMRWIANVCSAKEAHLKGDLNKSESLAEEALTIGLETGQNQALMVFGVQLGVIRYEQDRLIEIIDLYDEAARNNDGVPGLHAVLSFYFSEIGRLDEARMKLASAAENDFAAVPADSFYLTAIARYSQAAVAVGDTRSADLLYRRLLPYHDRILHTGASVSGSVEMFLGYLAVALGHFENAEAHLDAAAAVHVRIEAPLLLARTWNYRAEMLLARNEPGDTAAALGFIDNAVALAEPLRGAAIHRDATRLQQRASAAR